MIPMKKSITLTFVALVGMVLFGAAGADASVAASPAAEAQPAADPGADRGPNYYFRPCATEPTKTFKLGYGKNEAGSGNFCEVQPNMNMYLQVQVKTKVILKEIVFTGRPSSGTPMVVAVGLTATSGTGTEPGDIYHFVVPPALCANGGGSFFVGLNDTSGKLATSFGEVLTAGACR
jgi:hypothetical protein